MASSAPGLAARDFEGARRPNLEATTLPLSCYTSEAFFRLEVERIFSKEWLCVGRADQVPGAGDYVSFDLLGEPLVLVRDERRALQVLSRVCRHRSMLVVEGQGNARAFECPYHGWTYSLRGDLVGAPEMQRSKGFDRRQCGLARLRVETWEGFVFASFDPDAEPLAPRLTGLSKLLVNYRLAEMRSCPPLDYDCTWNWKLMDENFLENYHVQGLHKDTVNPVLPARNDVTEDLDGQYAVVHLAADEQCDVSISGDQGFSETPPFGVIPTLTPEERRKIILMLVYPTHLLFVMSDCMIYYQVFPEAADRIHLRINLCVPPEATAKPDFDENLAAAMEGIVQFNEQDMWACASTQRGMTSRFAREGRLCWLEKVVWQLGRYVMKRVGVEPQGGGRP
ncbi:MAG TPA: aromatic ring-hydroxylating dioxygenase subunit alpha [Candidatus Binatia bacterium]|jgi:phenylpropionate dioxygenase-like ring-hydroxylating dioxygenase large terminal subunit|nr:aromatic ring-hydroxylating dioxygenase subunit alpha [Candidatus Binatia bacterium]